MTYEPYATTRGYLGRPRETLDVVELAKSNRLAFAVRRLARIDLAVAMAIGAGLLELVRLVA